MTIRDHRSIHTLYFIHRYIPASIARLYGVSRKHVVKILEKSKSETVVSEFECQLCSSEDAMSYFIDGNESHNTPQNIIMLCEPDKRRFQHLQLRRRKGLLSLQMEATLQ